MTTDIDESYRTGAELVYRIMAEKKDEFPDAEFKLADEKVILVACLPDFLGKLYANDEARELVAYVERYVRLKTGRDPTYIMLAVSARMLKYKIQVVGLGDILPPGILIPFGDGGEA